MRCLKLIVKYDGTDFYGFQRIPGRRTVQGELERAIRRVMKENISIVGAGRTDAGVHASGQVVSFSTGCAIPLEKISIALNSILPKDISVSSASEVGPDFHARRSAVSRTYKYTILNSETPDALQARFTHWERFNLDVNLMQKAAGYLLGVHDLSSFCTADPDTCHNIREIKDINVTRQGERVEIEITANAFLRNMARIIVGTLIQVGISRINPEEVKNILEARDRRKAFKTASPSGLCLVNVEYKEPY